MTITGMTTFLWFDNQALEAASFYADLFDGKVSNVSRYQSDAQQPEGAVLTVDFELFGRPFSALNGGPQFQHYEAVSFQVHVETQADVDRYWDAIVSDGGSEGNCGWCKDRWGVSWQIIPQALGAALSNPDPVASKRAFEAMMKMRKIVIAELA